MFNYLLLFIILSSPSELLEKASGSLREHDLLKAQQYLDSAREMNLTEFEETKLFANQGYIFLEQNRLSEALLKFHESLRFLEESGEKSEVTRYMFTWINNNIGAIYYHYSNFELAIKYYDESLKHAIESERGELLYNLALSQSRMGLSEEAIDNLGQAFKLCVEYDQNLMKAEIQIKIGTMMRESGNYEESARYLNNVLSSDSLPSGTLAKAHNNYAITAWKNGDYSTAQLHFNKTTEIGDSKFQFQAFQNLSELYLEQGMIIKSIEAGIKAEELLDDQINNPENLKLYAHLSNAYESLGDHETALRYSRDFNDQMLDYYQREEASLDADDAYRIQMITENYELKVQQIEERRITIMVNILISSIILITMLLLIWQQQTKKNKMVREITEELLA